jgi:DNA processing protein
VGPVTFDQLIRRYGDAAKALPDLARRGGRATTPKIPSIADADRELADGEKLGAWLIAACEPDFPALLAALAPPPPLIWTRGDPSLLSRPCVAIVGARIASAAGQRFARSLAQDLGQAGQVIVSGMARGIDGAAHEGAMATGTVAVRGGGIEALLSPTPTPRDDLVRITGAPAAAVYAALTELALAGRAELLFGGLVARA